MITIDKISRSFQNGFGVILIDVYLDKILNKIKFETNFDISPITDDTIYNAALIALIPLSYEKMWDIRVNGVLDELLFNSLKSELLPLLQTVYDKGFTTRIMCTELVNRTTHPIRCSGTGVSCGVDSLATIKIHQDEIGVLAFFDAGSHGRLDKKTSDVVRDFRFTNIEKAANELKTPLLTVFSNIANFTSSKFQDNHAFLQIACAHLLSGKCDTYYYSSGQQDDYLEKQGLDFIYVNNFLVHTLSTNDMKVKSSLGDLSRIQRTDFISSFDIAKKHLDVCVDGKEAVSTGKINCSKCDKCLRTQLTLRLLGKSNDFQTVFDSQVYSKHENNFLAKLKLNRKHNALDQELFLMARRFRSIWYSNFYSIFEFENETFQKGNEKSSVF